MAEEVTNNGYSCPARPEPTSSEADHEKYIMDLLENYGYIASEDGVRNIIRKYRENHNI